MQNIIKTNILCQIYIYAQVLHNKKKVTAVFDQVFANEK